MAPPHTGTHTSTLKSTKRLAGKCIRFSPLPQHDNFWLGLTPLAEGEELVDNASRFAQQLLSAELQLFVALVNGRFHLPKILDGRCVQGIECGKSSNEVLKLFWKAESNVNYVTRKGQPFSSLAHDKHTPVRFFQKQLANLVPPNKGTVFLRATGSQVLQGKLEKDSV